MNAPASPLEIVSNGNVEVTAHEVKDDNKKPETPKAEELLARVNDIGNDLRAVIVLAKRLPRDKALEPHQDPSRALAQSQAHLQTGFMWLRKAITTPKEF